MDIRKAELSDIPSILHIYNQGIEDRIATLELQAKDETYMTAWFEQRKERFVVLVAVIDDAVAGWASINPYSTRCAYDGVGDISIYIHRDYRGKRIGQSLLRNLEGTAIKHGFYKLVLFTFPFNALGQALYKKSGYREVGVFQNQGKLDGKFVDVMAMEKIL